MNDTVLDEQEQAAIRQVEQMALHRMRHQFEVNRLLGGQAFLGGRDFRSRVLEYFHDRQDAVAPEYGMDMRLLTQICLAAEREQSRFDMAFLAAGVGGALGFIFGPPGTFWIGLIAAGVINAAMGNALRTRAVEFRRSGFDYSSCVSQYSDEPVPDRIDDALPRHDQNVVLYSGFLPFVGAGAFENSWSFNCALNAPREHGGQQGPHAFTTSALYARIKASMQAMAIPGLHCADRIFVRGPEARESDDLCVGSHLRPLQVMAPERFKQCMGANDERMRHYLCVQVAEWGGEIITTFHLRFVLRGNGLYVEMSRYFLGPVAEAFRGVDKIAGMSSTGKLLRLAGEIVTGPLQAIGAFGSLFKRALTGCADMLGMDGRRKRRMKQIEYAAGYDFGASSSLREALSTPQWRHYFQRSDEDFTRKLIERNVLDEIADFLEEHGIDSADVRERRTTILNNGIIVNGGDVRSETLAVGAGARATKNAGPAGQKAATA